MNIDKELRDQEAFEENSFSAEDKELYSLLMGELDKESGLTIEPSFSTSIIKKLEAKKKKEARWEFFLFASAIVGVLFMAVLAFSFVKRALQQSPDLIQNSPLAPAMLFAGLLIIFQFLDKKYLKDVRIKKRLKEI